LKINFRYIYNSSYHKRIKQLKVIDENCYCWKKTKKLLTAPAAGLK
jgi:hypothetical protein